MVVVFDFTVFWYIHRLFVFRILLDSPFTEDTRCNHFFLQSVGAFSIAS